MRELNPAVIIDIGAGYGTYHDLLAESLPNTFWIALEVFEPYVAQFGLRDKYDEVIVADARWLDWSRVGPIDLAICGDVIEHMPKRDAILLWEDLRSVSKHILLSIPIVEWPQRPSGGNAFLAHVASWTLEECLALPGVIQHAAYTKIGVFLATGTQK